MSLPKISIVTPSFNQGRFIRQTIESVLAQDYPNFEHIVMDGGSTDETLSILSQHPHLKWSSAPDKGQTDALNRGFEIASGEIVTWLNSDDWYAPRVFADVAEALQSAAVVMGRCELTDRDGKTYEVVENLEHTWFDILKYWVYHSIPAQPAIFFRREALEAVRREDGKFLDEELEFGMDYELWLRLAKRFPFTNRLPKTLAYARMYEDNKTGRDMAAAYNEYGRIYRRHCNLAAEHALAIVVPINGRLASAEPIITGAARQTLPDVEIVLADYSGDQNVFRALKKEVVAYCGRSALCLRAVQAEAPTYAGALKSGIAKCAAPIVAALSPATVVDSDFCVKALRVMDNNAVGICYAKGSCPVTGSVNGQDVFDLQSIFAATPMPEQFLVRKAAALEVGVNCNESSDYALRELCLGLLHKGWQVHVAPDLELPGAARACQEAPDPRRNARLIWELHCRFQNEPLAELRAKNGFAIKFPDALLQEARAALGL